MKVDAFRNWLSNKPRSVDGATLDARTIASRLSNCRTVERYEGDLDEHYDKDQLQSLLDGLKYSKHDERSNSPARHRIPIDGNVYNGTASLKAAVSLYRQFRDSTGNPNVSLVESRATLPPVPRVVKMPSEERAWPEWEQPSPQRILELAHATIPLVRFLNPDVVRAVIDDNEHYRESWIEILKSRGIDPSAYLWEGSPCAFPGVRRYAGSREIAAHRGHATHNETQKLNALALDDNDYPKQIWSFILRGAQFSKFGPEGYALAHLADHKDHGNRFATDFEVSEEGTGPRPLYGLYTCPTNTVYIPLSLIKPTDFAGTLRALLIRRAHQLYGSFCKILPPFLRIPQTYTPEWDINEFEWADPVGTTKHIPGFLVFRRDRMARLIKGGVIKPL
jgi:hypothetical protein